MAAFEELKIGEGIFTIKDMSEILKIPDTKVRYWFSKYVREALPKITKFVYNFEQGTGLFVNFKSLLQLYVFTELKSRGHSRKHILNMYSFMAKKYKTNYPFAHKEVISAGSDILIEEDGNFFNNALQLSMIEILEDYLHRIEFDSEGNALKYFPLGKSRSIVVDPQIQFGSPVIMGTRVNTSVINELFKAGDSRELISKVLDISLLQVNDAIEFYSNAA